MPSPAANFDLLRHIAGDRPSILKLIAGLGIADMLQIVLFGFSDTAALQFSAVIIVTMLVLEGPLLMLLWSGSRVARAGLAAFHTCQVLLGIALNLLLPERMEGGLVGFLGLSLSVALAFLVWHPAVSKWLEEAGHRRHTLSLSDRRQLVKLNVRYGLTWLLAPLFLAKVSAGAVPELALLILAAPAIVVGLAVLGAQGLALLRMLKG